MLTKMEIGKKSDAHESKESPRFASRLKKQQYSYLMAAKFRHIAFGQGGICIGIDTGPVLIPLRKIETQFNSMFCSMSTCWNISAMQTTEIYHFYLVMVTSPGETLKTLSVIQLL